MAATAIARPGRTGGSEVLSLDTGTRRRHHHNTRGTSMAASTGTGTSSHHTSGCRPASTNGTVAAATIRPVARLTTTA
ncbi:MAG TPA: hypothetical protein VGJ38_03795, partial [Jatrophihabitantaceae bacterium]